MKKITKKVTTNETLPHKRFSIINSEDLIADILSKVADGESLNKICDGKSYPCRKTFFEWVGDNTSIANRYMIALSLRAEKYADEIIEIADNTSEDINYDFEGKEKVNTENIARSKLRVDARKWVASKLLPKKYGDSTRVEVEHRTGLADRVKAARERMGIK
jgi:hypothetical protein